MRPISPNTGAKEVVVGEEQSEYRPISVARYHDSDIDAVHLVTRWTMTPEERALVASGADIFVAQVNFGSPMAPLIVQVGPGDYQLPEST